MSDINLVIMFFWEKMVNHLPLSKLKKPLLTQLSEENKLSSTVAKSFDSFIQNHRYLSGRQLQFLDLLKSFILEKGELHKRNLIESPFTMIHPQGVRGVFSPQEINEISTNRKTSRCVMAKSKKINIDGNEITVLSQQLDDYISLTDMARSQLQDIVIIKWLSLKSTIEYLGEWEALYNPDFNYTEFGTIKNAAGSNNFVLSVKQWLENTNAIGITAKAGRYGGTYAHKDIAFQFGMWISPKFQLLLVKEYQRLKEQESDRNQLEWNFQRTLAKVNYQIHTDAVKEKLVPETLSKTQIAVVYASEADLLNMALFGQTAKQWREANPDKEGNIRDHATIEQLVVLSNLESINAMLIHQGLEQPERLPQLNAMAITQMTSLLQSKNIQKLK